MPPTTRTRAGLVRRAAAFAPRCDSATMRGRLLVGWANRGGSSRTDPVMRVGSGSRSPSLGGTVSRCRACWPPGCCQGSSAVTHQSPIASCGSVLAVAIALIIAVSGTFAFLRRPRLKLKHDPQEARSEDIVPAIDSESWWWRGRVVNTNRSWRFFAPEPCKRGGGLCDQSAAHPRR